jgi:hypothetical protein
MTGSPSDSIKFQPVLTMDSKPFQNGQQAGEAPTDALRARHHLGGLLCL